MERRREKHTVTLTVEVFVSTRSETPFPSIEEIMGGWMNYDTQLLSDKALAEGEVVEHQISVEPHMTSWKVERPPNSKCPYPNIHASDCECEGMGGPR